MGSQTCDSSPSSLELRLAKQGPGISLHVALSTGEAFDWRNPTLRQIGLEDVARARLFVRLAIHESIIVVASKGKESAAVLQLMAETLHSHTEHKTGGAVLQAAIDEVRAISAFLFGLLSQGEMSIDLLDNIMSSKSGAKLLVAQLINQQSYLRDLEMTVRRYEIAERSFGEDVDKAMKLLHSGNVDEVCTVSAQFPPWQAALRPGRLDATSWENVATVSEPSVKHICLSAFGTIFEGNWTLLSSSWRLGGVASEKRTSVSLSQFYVLATFGLRCLLCQKAL